MVGVVGFDRPGVWAMPPSVDADENRLALDWKPPAPAKEKLGVLAPRAGVGESPRVGWDANAALDMNGFDAPPMLPKMPVDGELAAGAAPKAPKVEVEVAPNIPPEAAGAPNIPPDAAPIQALTFQRQAPAGRKRRFQRWPPPQWQPQTYRWWLPARPRQS